MGRTITREDAKNRSALDLLEEIMHGELPLIVTLESGRTVSIQDTVSDEMTSGETMALEPLPQFFVSIPQGWKDAIYDHV